MGISNTVFLVLLDLRQWIQDVKMNFISESDFDALWNAMDIDDSGLVDPIEFIVFLSACGPEFEIVYREQKRLPKSERAKLAARRLTNISLYGEEGVLKLERKLERRGLFGNSSSSMKRPSRSEVVHDEPSDRC